MTAEQDLPDPAPRIQRTLERHDAGAHCPRCDKTINLMGAFHWAEQHSEQAGHRVLVDYTARYVIHRSRKKAT